MPELERLIKDVTDSYPVDRSRIYLTGLSMGGRGTWDLAARRPESIAAIVPMCGAGNVRLADRLVGVPVWVFHGDADRTIPVAHSRGMIEALRSVGASPKYSELKGVGHDCWTHSYADLDGPIPWLFHQRNKSVISDGNSGVP